MRELWFSTSYPSTSGLLGLAKYSFNHHRLIKREHIKNVAMDRLPTKSPFPEKIQNVVIFSSLDSFISTSERLVTFYFVCYVWDGY